MRLWRLPESEDIYIFLIEFLSPFCGFRQCNAVAFKYIIRSFFFPLLPPPPFSLCRFDYLSSLYLYVLRLCVFAVATCPPIKCNLISMWSETSDTMWNQCKTLMKTSLFDIAPVKCSSPRRVLYLFIFHFAWVSIIRGILYKGTICTLLHFEILIAHVEIVL